MKRRTIAILLAVSGMLGVIAACGGVHVYTYSYYNIESGETGDFPFSFSPQFSKGGTVGLQMVIPFLWYRHKSPDQDCYIFIEERFIPRPTGGSAATMIVVSGINVRNDAGREWLLMKQGETRLFAAGKEDASVKWLQFGPVEGDVIAATIVGTTYSADGTESNVCVERSWKLYHKTRIGLGLWFVTA